jgi:UDP:flavonoid glycosyltransferase YjiC (YdhE family)
MRYLFAPIPFTGHVNPGLPMARELVRRGHVVRWYSSPRFKHAIENIGAHWVPLRHALPLDEERLSEMWPDRPSEGIAQMQHDIKNVFVEFIRGALLDLEEELRREPADVLIADNGSAVVEALHQKLGIPWAVYGMSVITMSSRDTAPFGLALQPSSTPLGRLRNKFLYWLVERVIFREASDYNQRLRREVGLPPLRRSIFDFAKDADLYLQSGVPSFDYPRTDLPDNVHFIGAPIPEPPANWTPPAWWGQVSHSPFRGQVSVSTHANGDLTPSLRGQVSDSTHADRDLTPSPWGQVSRKRVVLVTQGTINNDFDQLIRPAIRALADENVLVIVTTGSRNPEEVEIDPLPANVRIERFIPYAHLMPHVDLLLTNGGFGSIQIALAHGVPVVAIGKTEEKPEIANRVNYAGVGIGLEVLIPTETQIREAVRTVLSVPAYAARAEAMRYELSGLDAAKIGADLLEELAGRCDVEEEALEQSA